MGKCLTWLCGALVAGVEGGQDRAVDGPLEARRQVRGTAAHHFFAEVPARAHQQVLEHPARRHGLGAAAVRLHQLAQELLRQWVALRVYHLPVWGLVVSGTDHDTTAATNNQLIMTTT